MLVSSPSPAFRNTSCFIWRYAAISRSSLLSKCRYNVPSATPASAAIAAVVAAARPSRATIRAAACISFSRVAAPGEVTVVIAAKAPAMGPPVKINTTPCFIRRSPRVTVIK